MGVKVKGIKQVSRNVNRAIDNIQDRKVFRALTSAMIIGGSQAAIYTPIDTSYLINSQFREIVINGTRITGRVGYTASYAAYVHDPSIPQNFRRSTAQKEFLTKGFEDERELIDRTIAREMSL
ncbi:HK97 gp10 family phage protein [Duffyella gerundensis]|uniref:HK97 gp10 family phage protein n=1 Tax=Duffyella gerundensis TaxID=1619313 RepID=UPI0021F75AA3|nr:HK97 gp10 family phage protein [Duffyella gerundensis]